jgi:hypothetical protein
VSRYHPGIMAIDKGPPPDESGRRRWARERMEELSNPSDLCRIMESDAYAQRLLGESVDFDVATGTVEVTLLNGLEFMSGDLGRSWVGSDEAIDAGLAAPHGGEVDDKKLANGLTNAYEKAKHKFADAIAKKAAQLAYEAACKAERDAELLRLALERQALDDARAALPGADAAFAAVDRDLAK